jgi:uncharacterized membrane protein
VSARGLTRPHDRERGAVLPIVALSLVVLMVGTAFSVDIGRQIMRRREVQAVADVVALDLARQLDGRTRSEIESDPQWDQTRQDAAARNNFPEEKLTAVVGHWDPYAQVFTPSSLSDVPDSVQVLASDVVDFYFARVIGIDNGAVNRNAVGTQLPPPCCPPPQTALSTTATGHLGSVFAGFQFYEEPGVTAEYNVAAELRAQVMNSVLYTQFGMSGAAGTVAPPVGLGLDALSYKGLSNASIRLGDLAAALGFGSVNEALAATVTARELFEAEVTALRNSSDAADLAAANQIASFASSASSALTVSLGDVIRLAQGNEDRAADWELNALQLISSTGEVINGKNFFTTTINTSIPGVPTIPIRVAVIEPPQIVSNAEGSGPCTEADYAPSAPTLPLGCGPRTAQVRVAANIPVTLNLTPYGVPLVQATTIPVVFEAAAAQSYFTTIRCAEPTSNSRTNFRVVTNGIAMTVGSVSDAALQSESTMSVQAAALLHGSVSIGAIPPLVPGVTLSLDSATSVNQSKTFKNGAVYAGQSETNAGVLGADETHLFVGNLPSNIVPTSWRYAGGIGNTNISSTMFNSLGITNSTLSSAIASALAAQLGNLDTLLIDPVLSSLGLTVAGADGSITNVDCLVHLVK